MNLATTPTCCGTSSPKKEIHLLRLAHHSRDVTIPWKPNCQKSSACIVEDDIIRKNDQSQVYTTPLERAVSEKDNRCFNCDVIIKRLLSPNHLSPVVSPLYFFSHFRLKDKKELYRTLPVLTEVQWQSLGSSAFGLSVQATDLMLPRVATGSSLPNNVDMNQVYCCMTHVLVRSALV
ncbi:hypothetical protein AVEN_192465-1 [Araneus ventricosus]|uniref:Uncharacterized protein n=1 Tax=Araneus ventricosus TaxID=182803 RepID=A0A4Y2PA83_ARAVE|nr:hypothetical protein AVEN_192465-1 [Araneus ventricosus]